MSVPTLMLTEEDCLKDSTERLLRRNIKVGGPWTCDVCEQRFEDFRPHVHGDVKVQFGGEYLEAFCSEGCAIIRYPKEGEHA